MATLTEVYAIGTGSSGTLYNVASGKRLKINSMSSNNISSSENIKIGSCLLYLNTNSGAGFNYDKAIIAGSATIAYQSPNSGSQLYLQGALEDNT